MAIYITQGRYTSDAVKGLVSNPENREKAVADLMEKAGGKLHALPGHSANRSSRQGGNEGLWVTEAPCISGPSKSPPRRSTSRATKSTGGCCAPAPRDLPALKLCQLARIDSVLCASS